MSKENKRLEAKVSKIIKDFTAVLLTTIFILAYGYISYNADNFTKSVYTYDTNIEMVDSTSLGMKSEIKLSETEILRTHVDTSNGEYQKTSIQETEKKKTVYNVFYWYVLITFIFTIFISLISSLGLFRTRKLFQEEKADGIKYNDKHTSIFQSPLKIMLSVIQHGMLFFTLVTLGLYGVLTLAIASAILVYSINVILYKQKKSVYFPEN